MARIQTYLVSISVAMLIALVLTSCAVQTKGASQVALNTSGFGGTGKHLDPTSGFGGTGKSSSGFGGTGIIGTITEFGSIWVNGIEIAYGNKTLVSSSLRKDDTLKLGQQVVLKTEPNADKTFTKRIEVFYPIAGKITKQDKTAIEISGRYKVAINKQTFMDKGLVVTEGQYVAVNGYQDSAGNWVGTRLNLNPDHKHFYQAIPRELNQYQVDRWIIESGPGQIKQYASDLRLSLGAAHEQVRNRIVLDVMRQNKLMKLESIEDYSDQLKREGNKEMDSPQRVPHEIESMKEKGEHDDFSNSIKNLDSLKSGQELSQHQKEQLLEQQQQQMEMQKHVMELQQEQQKELKQIQEHQQELKQIQEQQQEFKQVQEQQQEMKQLQEQMKENLQQLEEMRQHHEED